MSHGPHYQRMQIRDHIASERRRRLIRGRPAKRDAPEPECDTDD